MNEVNRCKDCAFAIRSEYNSRHVCTHPQVNQSNPIWLANNDSWGTPCVVARGGPLEDREKLRQRLIDRWRFRRERSACGKEGKLFLPRDVAELCEDKKQQPLRAGPVAMPGATITSAKSALHALLQNTHNQR